MEKGGLHPPGERAFGLKSLVFVALVAFCSNPFRFSGLILHQAPAPDGDGFIRSASRNSSRGIDGRRRVCYLSLSVLSQSAAHGPLSPSLSCGVRDSWSFGPAPIQNYGGLVSPADAEPLYRRADVWFVRPPPGLTLGNESLDHRRHCGSGGTGGEKPKHDGYLLLVVREQAAMGEDAATDREKMPYLVDPQR